MLLWEGIFLFVVINVKESGKRKIRKGHTVDRIHEYRTSGAEKFYIADVYDSQSGVNWEEVAAYLGRHSRNVLLDRNIKLSDNSPVRRFQGLKYRNILLFNAAEMIFRQMYLSGCRTECVIYDPFGQYSFLLEKAARFSARTTVVTEREYMYHPAVSSLYTNFGAGVTVTNDEGVISPDAVIIDTCGNLSIHSDTLFSVKGNGITPKYVQGLNDLKALCPPYINVIDFLAAAYQFNNDPRTKDSAVRVFRRKNGDISASDLAEEMINRRTQDNGRLIFLKKL